METRKASHFRPVCLLYSFSTLDSQVGHPIVMATIVAAKNAAELLQMTSPHRRLPCEVLVKGFGSSPMGDKVGLNDLSANVSLVAGNMSAAV